MNTLSEIKRRIARMIPAEKDQLILNIIQSLYLDPETEELDPNRSWTPDTVEDVAHDIEEAGILR